MVREAEGSRPFKDGLLYDQEVLSSYLWHAVTNLAFLIYFDERTEENKEEK
ncbi:hypothetical protein [Caudoviricetes sp.]|nr:hypothetical protein [Caudoviricetes sp.]